MRTFFQTTFSLAISLSLFGCASMTGSSDQTISVQTYSAGQAVQGVMCELENNQGKWFVTTPGSVQVSKSAEDLVIICRKEGHDTGMASVVSSAGASVAGNVGLALLIPIVGIVGAVVDHNSGATYAYPQMVEVKMGETVTVKDRLPSEAEASGDASVQEQPSAAPAVEQFTITADGLQPKAP